MTELHRGRLAQHPKIIAVRPLTRDDLACLADKRPPQGRVAKFRDTHHRIARMFASGMRRAEIVERSGYSTQRVDTLCYDPAFQELISAYREKVTEAWVSGVEAYAEVATSNMLKAEVMLADKLELAEEAGELLPTRDLIAISRDAADRFGFGKRQTNTNVNVDFAAMLEKAIARSGKSNVIEAVAPHSPRPRSPVALPALAAPQESNRYKADTLPPSAQTPAVAVNAGFRRRLA